MGKLQIYSVEERDATTATCIVRCVGGTVRARQQFLFTESANTDKQTPPMILDWINVYGKLTDFLKPPYSATVHLTGERVAELERNVILSATTIDGT